jgi:hypothetical protein
MTTFSRETGYECQDFLLSRPIGWKRILFAKILVDAGIMLSGIIVGAVAFRLLLPGFYEPFVGIAGLLIGIGIAFGTALLGYMPGFASSAVLPGFWGSGIVLCLICVGMGAEATWIEVYSPANIGPNAWIGLVAAWVIGGIAASVFMAKRGMGLSPSDRAKRYAVLIAVFSSILLPLTIRAANRITYFGAGEDVWSNVSGHGSYVLTVFNNDSRSEITRVRDNVSAPLASVVRGESFKTMGGIWIDDRSLLLYPEHDGSRPQPLVRVWMDQSGKLLAKSYPKKLIQSSVDVSPGGRYAVIKRHGGVRDLVDTETMSTIQRIEGESAYWKSDDLLRVTTVPHPQERGQYRISYLVARKGIKLVSKTKIE